MVKKGYAKDWKALVWNINNSQCTIVSNFTIGEIVNCELVK